MGEIDFGCVLVFMLLYVSVGAIIGKVARNQPVMGALLAFLCGPVGWLLIALLSDRRLRCQACFGRVPSADATRCMHCGSELRFFAVKPGILDTPLSFPKFPTPPKTPEKVTPRCNTCGCEMEGVIEYGEAKLKCPKCQK